jgi:hypothetical protein
MTILRLTTMLTALAWLNATLSPSHAIDVAWDGGGATDDYNNAANWIAVVPPDEFVPDGTLNERAVINNGGLAFLAAASVTPTAGFVLGQGATESGTLEIRNGGNLTSIVGAQPIAPPDGVVYVGGLGTGTLRVLAGGTLTAPGLASGGNSATSIALGSSSGSPATINISGSVNLARTTRVRRTTALTAGSLSLQPESNYTVEISSAGHAIPMVNGSAQIGGRLTVEFTGVTPTLGSSYNLINAGSVSGAFESIQVSPNITLPLGQKWDVLPASAGGGRQFAQLKLDEFLVLDVNRGTGAVTVRNPGTLSKSLDVYSITSESGSLRPATWNSLDDQNVLGGDWGEANPTVNRLSELKFSGSATIVGGASQSLGIANSFNPSQFGTDTNDIKFEYMGTDGILKSGIVNYIGDPNNLLLTVDPASGQAQLKNTSAFTVAIDSYTIRSAAGSLSPTGWSSLDDQNTAGGNWAEANPTVNRLTELKAAGATSLSPGTAFSLGTLFTTSSTPDLEFEFLFDGEATPRIGVVQYGTISTGTPGDFDSDGDVDGRDFLVWQRGGSPAPLSSTDLAAWQNNYGTGGLAAVAAIPEPATWSLLLAIGLAARWRSSGKR